MYEPTKGTRVVTSSPDSLVKIWDLKTGKCTETLKGHNHYCYKAVFDNDGISVASVGADKVLNFWDLRSTKKPVFSNDQS
jgi:WD40 repeat protein